MFPHPVSLYHFFHPNPVSPDQHNHLYYVLDAPKIADFEFDSKLKTLQALEAQHPELFDWNSVDIPDCGTPGCAIGWIASHAGVKDVKEWPHALREIKDFMQIGDTSDFYDRMEMLVTDWRRKSGPCAKALRLYVDKYHPQKIDSIPESVRELFKVTA